MTYKSLELVKPEQYTLEGLEIGVTSNCNFKCDYCCAYNRDDGQALDSREIIRILEGMPDLKRVRLSGGEVTLKFQDCEEVVAYCASRGIATQLNSNASLLSASRIDRLAKAGLTTLHVSYNYRDASEWSRYYRLPESVHRKILENLRLAAQSSFDTVVETLLFEGTQNRLPEIHESAYELGIRTHEIQNAIRMNHTGWSSIAARDQLKQAVEELVRAKKEDMILYFTCMDRFVDELGLPQPEGVHYSHCIDGKTQLHLHGNGDVLICELCHPVIIGNIYKGTDLNTIYRDRPSALDDYLTKLPCPAFDALFPQGER
ncbi:radical SAM protein [Gorillibacterium timonense]|uniref:radical SAM protein n=1 Tax=Gorillibacterium timonense TaxID=1689269 RepID=UPI00071E2AD0|nr:radical SAM protein [Gorillibacterium timonense]